MEYQFDWSILITYAPLLLQGLWVTVQLSVISIVLSTVIGTGLGIARLARNPFSRLVAGAYVEFFLNTPLVIQLFFWYFALPMAFPVKMQEWLWAHNYEFISGVIGLTVYTSTFIAETVRAGIQSIDRGQRESALASGLSYTQAMAFVILPQAFRVVLPPLGSQFLNLTKNSSLAMTIAVQELTFQSQAIEAQTFRGFEATSAATLVYVVLTLSMSAVVHLVERRLSRHLKAGGGTVTPVDLLEKIEAVTGVS